MPLEVMFFFVSFWHLSLKGSLENHYTTLPCKIKGIVRQPVGMFSEGWLLGIPLQPARWSPHLERKTHSEDSMQIGRYHSATKCFSTHDKAYGALEWLEKNLFQPVVEHCQLRCCLQKMVASCQDQIFALPIQPQILLIKRSHHRIQGACATCN